MRAPHFKAGRVAAYLIVTASGLSLPLCAVQLKVAASGPHRANNVDRCVVTVTVSNDTGSPATNAEIELDIRPPAFYSQLTHFAVRIEAQHIGGGIYVTSFASPVEGSIGVVATDRLSLATAATLTKFIGPPLLKFPVTGLLSIRGQVRIQDAESDNCKKYFDKLDNEFYGPLVEARIAAGDDATKAALRERLDDLNKLFPVIESDIELEEMQAKGQALTAEQKAAFAAAETAAKASFQRNSTVQESLFKEFFGDPIDFGKFQKCTELFNNFELVANFDAAIAAVAAGTAGANGKIVENGPDASIAHVRWAKFANIAIDLDINKELWRNMKPILAKGTTITVSVLSDNDTTKDGTQPAKQTADQIKTIRDMYDPLKPKPEDTEDEKKRKIMEVEKKLIEQIKAIKVDKKVIAQLPTLDGTSTLVATITSSSCSSGDITQIANRFFSAVTLTRTGDALFGFGADNRGAAYVATGTVAGNQANFAISGFGLNPGTAPALTAYSGMILGDRITGTFQGVGAGAFGSRSDACSWSGTFIVGPRQSCDLDGENTINRDDLNWILPFRNIPAASADPRDPDRDGVVTVNDVRACTLKCSKPLCAP